MSGRSSVWPGAVLIAGALLSGGCGSSDTLPQWSVSVDAAWSNFPATQQDLGYTISVELSPYATSADEKCPSWSAGMHLQVNGQEETVAFDAGGCLDTKVTLGPMLQVDPITVDVLDGTEAVAHAEIDGVAPGTKATLVSPADGTFHGGDEIIVVPPPELPSGYISLGIFYPLDADTWSPMGTPVMAERLADGVHVTAPTLFGQVVLTFGGEFSIPTPTVACTGFALCTANASNALGPVLMMGAP